MVLTTEWEDASKALTECLKLVMDQIKEPSICYPTDSVKWSSEMSRWDFDFLQVDFGFGRCCFDSWSADCWLPSGCFSENRSLINRIVNWNWISVLVLVGTGSAHDEQPDILRRDSSCYICKKAKGHRCSSQTTFHSFNQCQRSSPSRRTRIDFSVFSWTMSIVFSVGFELCFPRITREQFKRSVKALFHRDDCFIRDTVHSGFNKLSSSQQNHGV